ncbi:hypothetical protein TSUD_186850 [Trifolium subterraneum]|uniref:Retrotransposon gag domain-containing protein n=1 Tax=Trifolium subterraneum TaxID=3900 RepID=A0A2Z6PFQ2_TRISU|nr:hypothetical protein TSUD_186850 [Trifolium subterraneum]
MAGVNNQEFIGENNPLNPPHHQQDGMEASVTPEGSATQAQVTPLDVSPLQHVPAPEDPLVVPQVPHGAPMEVVMDALVNTINQQGQLIHEQTANILGQNDLIRRQNRRIQAVENSSPRPAPRRNTERPLSPVREHPRWNNRSPPPRNNHTPPLRNNRSPPRRNNRSPPRNGEVVVRGGNARHSPMRESPDSGDGRHRVPLLRRIMDIPLPRGLEKPPSLDKYDGTTDPGEHIQSVETALDYRSLRGSIKCKLFPLSLHTSLLLEDGFRGGTKFQEAVGIMEMKTLDEFFELSQRYIKWEEKQIASEVRRPKNQEAGGPASQREERRGEEKKRDSGKVIEAKPPKSQFTYYTPLNAPRDRMLSEISNTEFKSAGIRMPSKSSFKRGMHDSTSMDNQELAITLHDKLNGSWENFPGALVISGGGFNLVIIGSIKRKFDELEKASPVGEIKITEVKESSVPLAFYREEVPGGSQNFQIPLLVRAKMANFDETLVPYVGSDLQGFNGSTTKPWGYVDLIVTFCENKAMKSVKVKFLVIDCPSLHNYTNGRPTLAELFAVSSTIHLKLKYYTKDGQVATINGDIEAARRCFEAASKNLNSVVTPKKKKEEAKLNDVNSINTEDAVELDARTSKKERKQETNAMKDDLLIKENYRPIPDGEFELVPLGEDQRRASRLELISPTWSKGN